MKTKDKKLLKSYLKKNYGELQKFAIKAGVSKTDTQFFYS